MSKLIKGEFPVSLCSRLSSPEAQILYTWMLHISEINKGKCFPSIDTLMKCTRMGRNRVIKYINQLESVGVIEKKKRYNESTIYEVRRQEDLFKQ